MLKNIDNKRFYELPEYWEVLDLDEYKKYMEQKIDVLLKIIPEDVKSILDVGCGNGVLTNILAEKYNVTAVDRSQFALKNVKSQKIIQSNISDLDLPSNSYDLVFSSEVLEHLSDDNFLKSVNKIKNLSKKYILITTPNNETIRWKFTKCYKCGYEFNAYYHFRSFNESKLKKFFNEYKMIFFDVCGKPYYYYNDYLAYIKQVIGNAWWKPDEKFFCPNCENEEFKETKPNFIANICDCLNNFYQSTLGKRCAPYWLFAMFEKNAKKFAKKGEDEI